MRRTPFVLSSFRPYPLSSSLPVTTGFSYEFNVHPRVLASALLDPNLSPPLSPLDVLK